MCEGGKSDAVVVVESPVAQWLHPNEGGEEEHPAISETTPSEMNHILAPYLDEESTNMQLFQRTNEANQCIGNVNIESSNNVHIGHVFKTIVQGDTKGFSAEASENCNKASSKYTCSIMIVLSAVLCLTVLVVTLMDANRAYPTQQRHDNFAPRSACGLRPSQHVASIDQVLLIVVDHSGGEQCFNFKSCCSRLLDIQSRDVDDNGLADIRYNFLIGGDGVLYEGRGFELANDISPKTMSVALIGDFTDQRPTETMMNAIDWLVLFGIDRSRIHEASVNISCYNQIRSVGDQRTIDSQLCRDVATSDKIDIYYARGTFHITDGEIYHSEED